MTEQQRREYEASLARAQAREDERQRIAEQVRRERYRITTAIAMLARVGAMPVYLLRRAQVRALDTRDLSELMTAGATFEMIETLKTSGLTILLVEQNVNQALAVADRAYVMRLGRIAAEEPAGEIAAGTDLGALYLGGWA